MSEQVIGYQKKSIRDHATLDLIPLDLPETTFDTEAIWYLPEPEMLEGLETMPRLLRTQHAPQHSKIALLPVWGAKVPLCR